MRFRCLFRSSSSTHRGPPPQGRPVRRVRSGRQADSPRNGKYVPRPVITPTTAMPSDSIENGPGTRSSCCPSSPTINIDVTRSVRLRAAKTSSMSSSTSSRVAIGGGIWSSESPPAMLSRQELPNFRLRGREGSGSGATLRRCRRHAEHRRATHASNVRRGRRPCADRVEKLSRPAPQNAGWRSCLEPKLRRNGPPS